MAEQEVLAVVEASQGRRILGLGSLVTLGVLLILVAVKEPPAIGWQIFLLVLGGASLWVANQMRIATAERLELTDEGIRDTAGRLVARIQDIETLDRGMFAFKPSNGFLMRLSAKQPNVWAPGLWWRVGRRVGIGGMTPGSQTKFMAEMISAMIAER